MARRVPPVGDDVIVAMTAEGKPLPLAADSQPRWRAGRNEDWSATARSSTLGLPARHEANCRRIRGFTLIEEQTANTHEDAGSGLPIRSLAGKSSHRENLSTS